MLNYLIHKTSSSHLSPVRGIRETRNSAVAVIADRTAYCVYWQNIKPVSVTNFRTAGMHDPIQRIEFMNAPNLYLLKPNH